MDETGDEGPGCLTKGDGDGEGDGDGDGETTGDGDGEGDGDGDGAPTGDGDGDDGVVGDGDGDGDVVGDGDGDFPGDGDTPLVLVFGDAEIEYIAFPQTYPQFWAFRFGVILPGLALTAPLLYARRVIERVSRRYLQEVTFALTVTVLLLLLVFGSLGLTAMGLDHQTALTSVMATLFNIGPGLAAVGPYGYFGFMPDAAKLLLSLFMILGRLEFYAVAVLLVPRFWR